MQSLLPFSVPAAGSDAEPLGGESAGEAAAIGQRKADAPVSFAGGVAHDDPSAEAEIMRDDGR
jgi:hypothetical protein